MQIPWAKYPKGKYPRDKYPKGKYPTDKYPKGKYPKYPKGKYPLSMKYQHVTCQYNILSKYLIHVHITRVGGCDVAVCDIDAHDL
jgi:hypothetical protein